MTKRIASATTRRSRSCLGAARPLVSVALAGAVFFVFGSKDAHAQAWLKDKKVGEGSGIRVGDFELHPGIGGEIGYDSNWFLRTYKQDARFVNGAPQNPPVEAGVLRITPSITLTTLSGQRLLEGGTPAPPQPLVFSAGLAATYREFLGPQEVRDQRNVSLNAFARADVYPSRPLGFAVFANYQRLIQPSPAGRNTADPNLSFNRDDVGAGAEVIVIPGGGTLDMRAGYQIQGALFEDSEGVPYTNITHEISVRNRWRFRPRTALFHDTTLRFISYPNSGRSLNYLDSSTPVRTRFGVTGLLTDRFGVLLAAGYGATFLAHPELGAATSQYDSINAQAEGTIYLSAGAGANEPGQATLLLSTLTFGFSRDFQNSLLGNYYTSDRGYLKLNYNFGSKWIFQLDGYVEALTYPQPFYNNGTATPVAVNGADGRPTGGFTNIHVGGAAFGEYRISQAFGINATIDYSQMISDVALEAAPATTPGGQAQLYDLSWRRIQAFIGVRYFY